MAAIGFDINQAKDYLKNIIVQLEGIKEEHDTVFTNQNVQKIQEIRQKYINKFKASEEDLVHYFKIVYKALGQGNATAKDELIDISIRIKELIIYYMFYENGGKEITSTQFIAFVKDMFGDDLFAKFYAFSRTSFNEYNKTSAGGRRRSRHAKKTRRNKHHAKKTRRHRKH